MKTRLTISFIFLAAILFTAYTIRQKKEDPPKNESSQNSNVQAPVSLTKHHFSEPHMGTVVRIVFYSELDKTQAEKLAKRCFDRIRELNAMLSDYLPDSEVSKLSQLPIGQPHKVSEELFTIVSFAQTISEKTDGAFDITFGKHTQRWRQKAKNQPAEVDEQNQKVEPTDYRDLVLDSHEKTITLKKELKIDLGAIGKGYIADQMMKIIKAKGITKAAVIIGGETVLADAPPNKKGWHIGIENPEHKIIGKLVLSNTAVSTSGDSYQFFEVDGKREAHLIDPKTKQGKTNRLNVTTIAPTAMEADAWATALRILPTPRALEISHKLPKLEALFIPHQKELLKTDNFPEIKPLQKK